MKGNVAAVSCEFKYSRAADGFLLAAATATLALVLAMPLSPDIQASLALLVVALAARARRGIHRVRAVWIDGARAVVVEDRDGRCHEGVLRDGSFVAPWLTIVRWRPRGAWLDQAVVILPAMLRAEDFRRLRVLLRWG